MRRILPIFLLLILAVIIFCTVDHGLAPLPGKLVAHVYFHDTPPEDTQGVYLIVAPEFPPHAINELYHSSNSLPIDQDTVIAEMDLPFGHYAMLSLWWYSTETKSNLADWLVLPLDNDLMPLGFDITREQPAFHIDLDAYWDRVDHNAAIEGTITFNGPFPSNTMVTAVAAYSIKPESGGQYLAWLRAIDFSVGTNPYHYRLPVTDGYIQYVVVFWLPENAALTEFSTLGFYEDPLNPGQPGYLEIDVGQTIENIDIYADWTRRNAQP
ncbi:hypothetical protein JXO59_08870 [candidate division KSB1 bacterium]|nr:hypothetical protein [candidate division KSB1 bacterium]